MKSKSLLTLLIIFVLTLSACGNDVGDNQTEEISVEDVYTAVANTLTAEADLVEVTTTATPTATSTASLEPTITSAPVITSSTPVAQSAAPYVYSASSDSCNDAVYVSDVTIPDGTILAPGEEFKKTWQFQNTGTCDWSEDYLLTFISGDDMDGDTTTIDEGVASGDTDSISVWLVAPETTGTYTGYWRLADEDGGLFGESVYVQIVVSDDAATITPTPTLTTTADDTSTPTATPTTGPTTTFTATALPSATKTATVPCTPTNTITTTTTQTPEPTGTFTPTP